MLTSEHRRRFSGPLLRAIREAKGWTQEEAAAVVAELTPCSSVVVGEWERGERKPEPDEFIALCIAFDCHDEELTEYSLAAGGDGHGGAA